MTIQLIRKHLLFVLTAPSGAGKTSVHRALIAGDPQLAYSVSTTTRPIREGEINGVSYDFVTVEQFERMRAAGEFLESAMYMGNLYGTRHDTVERFLAGGRDAIMDVDVQGARSIRASGMDAALIFILPPSMSELERRLRLRATEGEAVIARRMARAREEMAAAMEFDYLVINDDLERAVAETRAIIIAERRRAGRQTIHLEGDDKS
ncbi:MAG: guanylate kinase [Candidatus Sumerlaeota bacterium]|nr:guanylate kinase [Candidatus Sumerlaeota bacterium]